MCVFLDGGAFVSHGCRLSVREMALECGKIVPVLVSTNDDNWYCRGLVTPSSCWMLSWIGAEILDNLV